MDEKLNAIKEEGKLFDFDVNKSNEKYKVDFEINAMKMSDEELLSRDGEDFDVLLCIAKIVDGYFPDNE